MTRVMSRPCRRRWGKMGENMHNEELLSTVAAAAVKGVSRGAVHKAIRDGRLPAVWVQKPAASWRIDRPGTSSPGGSWKIQKADLDAWQPVHDLHERQMRGGRPKKDQGAER